MALFTVGGPQWQGPLAAKDGRVLSLPWNQAPLENRDPWRGAQLEGRGLSPGQLGGSRGSELGASSQTQQGTLYHGILGLGKVNEIGLLPPALLLPLVEAVRQDHTALALEESSLWERKYKCQQQPSAAREGGPGLPGPPSPLTSPWGLP